MKVKIAFAWLIVTGVGIVAAKPNHLHHDDHSEEVHSTSRNHHGFHGNRRYPMQRSPLGRLWMKYFSNVLINNNKCNLIPEYGFCDLKLRRWYYSHRTNECREFPFSGCGGNQNNFLTKSKCEAYCVESTKTLESFETEKHLSTEAQRHNHKTERPNAEEKSEKRITSNESKLKERNEEQEHEEQDAGSKTVET